MDGRLFGRHNSLSFRVHFDVTYLEPTSLATSYSSSRHQFSGHFCSNKPLLEAAVGSWDHIFIHYLLQVMLTLSSNIICRKAEHWTRNILVRSCDRETVFSNFIAGR
jgi:hypothetical protein